MGKYSKYTDVLRPDQISIRFIWAVFEKMVIPVDASEIQRDEMRKAFYAGFTECFKITCDISELKEKDALKVLDRLSLEGEEFFKEMMAGH